MKKIIILLLLLMLTFTLVACSGDTAVLSSAIDIHNQLPHRLDR